MTIQEISNIKNQLLNIEKPNIDNFVRSLEQSFSRQVQGVSVIVLHGILQQIFNVENAIEYIQNYQGDLPTPTPALKYEIDVRYNNSDIIHAIFQSKVEAIKFLRTFV